jgi:hypothetical protein
VGNDFNLDRSVEVSVLAPNVKVPSSLRYPWPPTDDLLQEQPVLGWDDWWSLQQLFKRCDAWDIIFYNFATYNPEEVNWYLRERIGCHDVSGDGKNYRFGALPNGQPMHIYIPTDDWLPPGPQQADAKRTALQILRDPFASSLSFKVGSVELTPGDLLSVATAIDTGKIALIHRPCLGWMAEYQSGRNRLLVPFARTPDLGMRALMVHEAVHAAKDIDKTPLTMQESEALAYIAQALYLRRNGVDIGASVVQPPFIQNPRNFVAWTGIFKFAARIAEDIDHGNPVSDVDVAGLALSITVAPTYENEGAPLNDGI